MNVPAAPPAVPAAAGMPALLNGGLGRPGPSHSSSGTAQKRAYRPAAAPSGPDAAENSSAAPLPPAGMPAGGPAAGRCGAARAAPDARAVIACTTSKDDKNDNNNSEQAARPHYTQGGARRAAARRDMSRRGRPPRRRSGGGPRRMETPGIAKTGPVPSARKRIARPRGLRGQTEGQAGDRHRVRTEAPPE